MQLNPFSLETKFEVIDQKIARNLWRYLPAEFCNYINLDENFKKFNELNLKFGRCYNIAFEFLNDDGNFELMKEYLKKYYIICQMTFSKLFPNYYLRNEKKGIKLRVFYE